MFELQQSAHTKDGSLDRFGKPAVIGRTGGWKSGLVLLGIFVLNVRFPFVGLTSVKFWT